MTEAANMSETIAKPAKPHLPDAQIVTAVTHNHSGGLGKDVRSFRSTTDRKELSLRHEVICG